MSEKKKIWEKTSVQIGIGVLLYFLLRGGNSESKVKTENKPVEITGDNNEVTKGVKEINIIRIDPKLSIRHNFKNSEYFGSATKEVPQEHYQNWGVLATGLQIVRDWFRKPITIVAGYDTFKDGRTAIIKSSDNAGLWESVQRSLNRNVFESVVKLKNGMIKVVSTPFDKKSLL